MYYPEIFGSREHSLGLPLLKYSLRRTNGNFVGPYLWTFLVYYKNTRKANLFLYPFINIHIGNITLL